MRLVTANVNGIRAAARKGGLAELLEQDADVVCLQETRAEPGVTADVLSDAGFHDYQLAQGVSPAKGRNGVAILSRTRPQEPVSDLEGVPPEGRFVAVRVPVGAARSAEVTVASVYVPKGYATPQNTNDPRDVAKQEFLHSMTSQLKRWQDQGQPAVVCGDFNVARAENDIRNWRNRIGKSGFLPREREVLDSWAELGWSDATRDLVGDRPGPYTWWSMRGRAFDNDAGWRIDYVWSLGLEPSAAKVLKASSWDARWSDHAALVVDFSLLLEDSSDSGWLVAGGRLRKAAIPMGTALGMK